MASSLRGVEYEAEHRIACAEMPLARLSQNGVVKSTVQSGDTMQINRLEKFAKQTFASFLEVAPDAVVVADRDGRIIRVNAQTERMFQYSRAELLGCQIEVLIPERFRERHVQQRAAYSDEPMMRPMGVGQRQLYGLRRNGQEFPVEISLGVLPTDVGFLVASAIRDVSEQRRLEQELSERTRQLEEANRNKDEFLGMLSHELRNPLAATLMAVEVLRQIPSVADPEPWWDVISRQTMQILHLVDDLMDVSRIAHGKIRIQKVLVDLRPLISQAVEAVQPLLNTHKQQLTVSLPPRPVRLLADPVRLIEIFTNLLNNASKYTDEGGIGIGLAMVAHLVRLHGGTVHVYSDGLGHGSRFVVRLRPLSTDSGGLHSCDGCDSSR